MQLTESAFCLQSVQDAQTKGEALEADDLIQAAVLLNSSSWVMYQDPHLRKQDRPESSVR
jgi:hypothetical protein